jgi:hypothetical protein
MSRLVSSVCRGDMLLFLDLIAETTSLVLNVLMCLLIKRQTSFRFGALLCRTDLLLKNSIKLQKLFTPKLILLSAVPILPSHFGNKYSTFNYHLLCLLDILSKFS